MEEAHEIEGNTWEGAIDEENNIMQLATYMGRNAVKVTLTGSDAEEDGPNLGEILATVKLTWETEESAFGICEERDPDFFELRSMKLSNSFSNRSSLQATGYDWSFLFRQDGTFSARLDSSVTNYIYGFGSCIANGTWKDGVLTFTNEDKSFTLAYTLEGDQLSIVFDDVPANFQRSNATPPDFNAISNE
jgi:hypothetical protein